MIYLDNAATTPIDEEVLNEMLPFMKASFGNAGSPHNLGITARKAVEKARVQVASFLNACPEQIIFTSGGSEANTLAIVGSIPYISDKYSRNAPAITMSQFEHDSVLNAGNCMFQRTKCYVTMPDAKALRNGYIHIDEFYRSKLALAAVMYYNNEVNLSFNPKQIAESAHEYGALFHTDCVQAAGYAKLDVESFGCDTMSISSHKIYGPKGVGALYVRDKSKLSPIVCGSGQQEFGLRGGTENVAGIVGFGKACELAEKNLETRKQQVDTLVSELISKLKLYATKYRVENIMHFNFEELHGKNVSVRFDGIDAQTLIIMLSNYGVYTSAGSACHGKSTDASHVLKAIGLTDEQAHNTLRLSVSPKNKMTDMDAAAKAIINSVILLMEGVIDNEDP